VNEAAKYRYRSGGQFNCGGLTMRAPYGEHAPPAASKPSAPQVLGGQGSCSGCDCSAALSAGPCSSAMHTAQGATHSSRSLEHTCAAPQEGAALPTGGSSRAATTFVTWRCYTAGKWRPSHRGNLDLLPLLQGLWGMGATTTLRAQRPSSATCPGCRYY